MKTGIELITEERTRQVSEKGWTPEHDDTHVNEEIAEAAACYASPYQVYAAQQISGGGMAYRDFFPWGSVRRGRSAMDADVFIRNTTSQAKDGKSRLRQLTIAGALIAAEIDRLQRISPNTELAQSEPQGSD